MVIENQFLSKHFLINTTNNDVDKKKITTNEIIFKKFEKGVLPKKKNTKRV